MKKYTVAKNVNISRGGLKYGPLSEIPINAIPQKELEDLAEKKLIIEIKSGNIKAEKVD